MQRCQQRQTSFPSTTSTNRKPTRSMAFSAKPATSPRSTASTPTGCRPGRPAFHPGAGRPGWPASTHRQLYVGRDTRPRLPRQRSPPGQLRQGPADREGRHRASHREARTDARRCGAVRQDQPRRITLHERPPPLHRASIALECRVPPSAHTPAPQGLQFNLGLICPQGA